MTGVQTNTEINSVDELVAYYHHVNWDNSLYVGLEWERSGVYRDSQEPVTYLGDNGYNAILHKLVEELGWEISSEKDGQIYQVQRGDTRIDIEGDGRLELAGSPQEDLHDLARELRLHNNEVVEMGNIFGVGWLSLGQQPLHTNEEITMLEKERYKLLKNIGDREMMETMTKRLNGITANMSYLNEENAIRKAQTAFRVLPIVGSIFACSPFHAGKRSAFLDARRYCIQHHAPQRTGIPKSILSEQFTMADWFEYYLSLPVVLITDERGTERRPDRDITFAQWMEEGYKGNRPTIAQFDQHVKTTWSDIRLRPSYLEYRVADSTPYRYIMALPALMKGLLFDSDSWKQVQELTQSWSYEDVIAIDQQAWKTGLQTEVQGKTLLTYAQEIITIADEKLHQFERSNSQGDDESVYLAPLKDQILIKGMSPAEELVSLYEGDWNQDASRILEWCELEESQM